ncbi:MAG: succinate dehydrogenase/fumarate reductase cytochrome b subunit [Bacteroidales bacterium]|nr:succinate dehydrogenase/fumarate reductase cytochrome b subunit [Bacteroidales bacterium]
MWLFNSSIGRKFVMALTGAFLVLFVTFHVLMNGVAIFWPAAYNVVCEFLGANWYALIGSAILALGFIIHIIFAVWLTLQNRNARGNDRYNVVKKPFQVEWSSQNMLVLGIVILAFLCIHMIQFWAKMQLAEICHFNAVDPDNGLPVPAAAGTWFLQIAFSQWYTLPIYIIGFAALWFHMTHGFWSMFQTCGWNGQIWLNRTKCIANWWTSIVIGLFLIEAIVFTVQANKGAYTSCPELQEQYIEMMAEGQDAIIPNGICATPCQGHNHANCQGHNHGEACEGKHNHHDCDAAKKCEGDKCADKNCEHAVETENTNTNN